MKKISEAERDERWWDRLWARIDVNGPVVRPGLSPCWIWNGARGNFGYGMVMYRGKLMRLNRLFYALATGELPGDLFACHHCDNPPCCNPDHLFAGTSLDNAQDMISKGRGSGRRPKLSGPEEAAIREWYAFGGRSYAVFAEAYGVAAPTIMRIVRRQTCVE